MLLIADASRLGDVLGSKLNRLVGRCVALDFCFMVLI